NSAQNRRTKFSTFDSGDKARPTTQPFRTPPAPQSRPAAAPGSRQWTPSPIAKRFQRQVAFDSFSCWRELPCGKTLDAGVLAHLALEARVPFHAALGIRRLLEGSAKKFLLLGAMRTPVRAIHHDAPVFQAPGEGIVAVVAFVFVSQGGGHNDGDHDDNDDRI